MDRLEVEALDRIFGARTSQLDDAALESRREAERLIIWARPKTKPGSGYSLGQSQQALVPICVHIICKRLQTTYCSLKTGATTACITPKDFTKGVQTVEAAMSNLAFPYLEGKGKTKKSSIKTGVDYDDVLDLLEITIPERDRMVDTMDDIERYYLEEEQVEEGDLDGGALRCAVVLYLLGTLKIQTHGFGASGFAREFKLSANEIRSLLDKLQSCGYDDDGRVLREFRTTPSSNVRTRSTTTSTSRPSSPVKVSGSPVKNLLPFFGQGSSPTKMSPRKRKAQRIVDDLHNKDPVTPSKRDSRREESEEGAMDVDQEPESPSKRRKRGSQRVEPPLVAEDDLDLIGSSSRDPQVDSRPSSPTKTSEKPIGRNLFASSKKKDASLPDLQKLALNTPSTSPLRRSQRPSESQYHSRTREDVSLPQTPTRTRKQTSPSKSPTKRVRIDLDVDVKEMEEPLEEERKKPQPSPKKTSTTLPMRPTSKRKPKAFLDHMQWCKVDPRVEKLKRASEEVWKEMVVKHGEPVF